MHNFLLVWKQITESLQSSANSMFPLEHSTYFCYKTAHFLFQRCLEGKKKSNQQQYLSVITYQSSGESNLLLKYLKFTASGT